MPPISLRVTPIHHLAEVCVGNPYWIFNEREYNAIQSQWVCQCPRLHTHTHTHPLRYVHTSLHTHTHREETCVWLVVLFEIALHFPNRVRASVLKGSCCNCVCPQRISHFCRRVTPTATQQDLWTSSAQINVVHFFSVCSWRQTYVFVAGNKL